MIPDSVVGDLLEQRLDLGAFEEAATDVFPVERRAGMEPGAHLLRASPDVERSGEDGGTSTGA